MIGRREYSKEEIDTLYSVVEDAVAERKPVDMFKISRFIKTGDFYLISDGANGLLFSFDGLKWVKDNRIYCCLIQPQIYGGDIMPTWYPVITYDDRSRSSSGDLSMIKKENRYMTVFARW